MELPHESKQISPLWYSSNSILARNSLAMQSCSLAESVENSTTGQRDITTSPSRLHPSHMRILAVLRK